MSPAVRCGGARSGEWGGLPGREDVLVLLTETTGLRQYDAIVEVAVIDTTGETRFKSRLIETKLTKQLIWQKIL